MQPLDLFQIAVLIFSVVLHEVAHGYMANYLGDPTARLAGRLTLNPISHIDLFGSVILPGLLIITNSPFLIGYAKPVPVNPYNLSGRFDEAKVAFAGPGTNIVIALIFGLVIRFFGGSLSSVLVEALVFIVFINLLLALFNLVPIPPLDGSKVLSSILPEPLASAYDGLREKLERLGIVSGLLIIVFVFYFFLAPYFSIILRFFINLITGIPL
ncbi:MAG TPA: site-2 protease family protein [Candidatus Paceibacterota bacterium]|nr:site-2 protease family protein [Candidatus Paceibacterota bacterium]